MTPMPIMPLAAARRCPRSLSPIPLRARRPRASSFGHGRMKGQRCACGRRRRPAPRDWESRGTFWPVACAGSRRRDQPASSATARGRPSSPADCTYWAGARSKGGSLPRPRRLSPARFTLCCWEPPRPTTRYCRACRTNEPGRKSNAWSSRSTRTTPCCTGIHSCGGAAGRRRLARRESLTSRGWGRPAKN